MAPYSNPQSGVVPPFFTVGPFASTDTLFPGTAGDLDLFTDMEISGLVCVGLLKPPITVHTILTQPHLPRRWSKLHPPGNETPGILQAAVVL